MRAKNTLTKITIFSTVISALILSFANLPCAEAENIYYVAKTGNDTNSGSETSPFLTIQKAIDAAIAPAIVKVGQGTYDERIYITKDVSIYGGYESNSWTRDINSYPTIIDGRAATFSPSPEITLDTTVTFRYNVITRNTVFEGFTIYGPVFLDKWQEDVGGAHSMYFLGGASPTISNVTIYGPERGVKITTITFTTRSAPLFKNCKIYVGRGNNPRISKIIGMANWGGYPEFEYCEIYPGKSAVGSYRTFITTLNTRAKFTNTIFYPPQESENPDAIYFTHMNYMDYPNWSQNYDEFYNNVFYGANTTRVERAYIIRTTHGSYTPVDWSKYVLVNNDFILDGNTHPEGKINVFSDIDLETTITQAGGIYQDNRFWISPEEYQSWLGGSNGDVNGDGKVDILDLYIVAHAFDSRPQDPNWDPRADINKEGDSFEHIDIDDLYPVTHNFGYGVD